MANLPPQQWSEPQQFVSGDTLNFRRNLPGFQPVNGWSIQLTVSKLLPVGAQEVAQVVSVADATNTVHTFFVENFLAGQAQGDYVMSEELICSPTGVSPGETHGIYYSPLKVLPNLAAGGAAGNIETQAQRKLRILDETHDDLCRRRLKETDVQRTRLLTVEIDKILDQIKYWKEARTLEMQHENAKNGRPPGNVMRPIFNIGF